MKDEFDVSTTVSAHLASSVCHFSSRLSVSMHALERHRHTSRTPSMVSMSRRTSSRCTLSPYLFLAISSARAQPCTALELVAAE
ncbi:MAG TPA: hypothetical protein VK450_03985 [Methanomicrobiales archaeon]|nr:hypothetical protein [Methanomicrobiales archaeon]